MSRAWIPEGISSPLLFNALIASASTTLGLLRDDSSLKLLRLYHQGELVKELNKVLGNPDQMRMLADEIVIAVNALAFESGTVLPEVHDNPFNTPFGNLSFTHIYGRIVYDQMHGKALVNFISMIGGLDKLRMLYMPSTISG